MMMLAALKDTTRLALDDRGLRGDVLEFKAVCSFLKKAFFVEEVDLSRNDLGAEQAQALAASIAANGSIVDLKLSGNSFGTEGMQVLAKEALCIRSFRHLSVAGNGLGVVGFQALAETPLESLDVGSNDLGPNCAEALVGTLCIRSLRHLSVASNGLGAAGFQALAEAFAGTSLLESLDVGSNDLGANCTEALKTVLSIATLKDLRADRNALAGAIAEAVTETQPQNLRHLSVAGNDLGTAGFQALAESLVETGTQVETIDVGSNGIGEDCWHWGDCSEALKMLLGTTTLKVFRAAHNALGDAGAQAAAECLDSDRCAIERLSLVANGIGRKGFEALASTQRHAAVQLHISGNLLNLDWQSRVEAAADLSRCFTLMDVVVAHDDDKSTPDDKAQEVRQALRDGQAEIFWRKPEWGDKELATALQGHSRLQVLQIEPYYTPTKAVLASAVLEALEGHVMLKSLVLTLSVPDTKALGCALDGKSGLEELVFQHSGITAEGMKALAPALKVLAALKVLNLESNDLGDDGAKARRGRTGSPRAWSFALDILRCDVMNICKALAEFLTGLSLLEHLYLHSNNIHSEGAQALAPALKGLAALKVLNLGYNHLGPDGAKALAPALKGLAALKVLDLGWNDLQPDGAKALAESLTGMSLLEQLNLSLNKIGSEGAQALAESLTGMSLLEQLNLSLNKIGSEGAQALAPALKGLAALKVLDLHWNDSWPEGAKALVQVLLQRVLVHGEILYTDDVEDGNGLLRRAGPLHGGCEGCRQRPASAGLAPVGTDCAPAAAEPPGCPPGSGKEWAR
eukprot:s1473_g2.t6